MRGGYGAGACGRRGMEMRLEVLRSAEYRSRYGGDAPLDQWPSSPGEGGGR